MKLFIWERVSRASTSYHDEGGIAVIAEDIGAAHDLLRKPGAYGPPVPDDCEAFTASPDVERECGGPAGAWVFPDAGCC